MLECKKTGCKGGGLSELIEDYQNTIERQSKEIEQLKKHKELKDYSLIAMTTELRGRGIALGLFTPLELKNMNRTAKEVENAMVDAIHQGMI